MPFVQPLQTGAIAGVGAKPPNIKFTNSNTISIPNEVRYKFVHMVASVVNNRFSCAAAAHAINSNGCYLFFDDDWSTVAPLDVLRPVVASGNFSGCGYNIFRRHQGGFLCAHVPRPGGVRSEDWMGNIGYCAEHNGWTEIRSFTTAGLVNVGGCREVYVVSELMPGQHVIRTIRLEVNNMGLTTNRTLYNDPI